MRRGASASVLCVDCALLLLRARAHAQVQRPAADPAPSLPPSLPPSFRCKAFTPQLIQLYSKLKIADGKNFEIVLVSADRSQEAFDAYFGKMPWLAVDFAGLMRESERTRNTSFV